MPNGSKVQNIRNLTALSKCATGYSGNSIARFAPISTRLGSAFRIWNQMPDQITCSYCGKSDFAVGEKPLRRFTRQYRILLKTPLCGRCFLEIKNKKMPITATLSEYALLEKVSSIKSATHGLSKQTPMHRIQSLCDEVDLINKVLFSAVQDFDLKAREAQQAAQKVEWIRSSVDAAKSIISEKLNSSYENCRRIADQCCSNPEIRNFVFTRDGGICVLCGGNENLSVDHIRPVKKGGSNEPENLQTLCVPCNSSKGVRFTG